MPVGVSRQVGLMTESGARGKTGAAGQAGPGRRGIHKVMAEQGRESRAHTRT